MEKTFVNQFQSQ